MIQVVARSMGIFACQELRHACKKDHISRSHRAIALLLDHVVRRLVLNMSQRSEQVQDERVNVRPKFSDHERHAVSH